MKLNEITDNPGASRPRMRVGRGIGSGKGKTAGRGVKGQKARSGVAVKGFEGGQMPLHRRLPKRGFNKPNAIELNEVNIGRIQQAVDAGKLDKSVTVTNEALVAAGVISKPRDGVKNYVATTVAEGRCLGAALAPTAGTEDLQAAYGAFASEARDIRPDYRPRTVSVDDDGSADAARRILTTIAAAIITVVGVVFSIILVTLTLAST